MRKRDDHMFFISNNFAYPRYDGKESSHSYLFRIGKMKMNLNICQTCLPNERPAMIMWESARCSKCGVYAWTTDKVNAEDKNDASASIQAARHVIRRQKEVRAREKKGRQVDIDNSISSIS